MAVLNSNQRHALQRAIDHYGRAQENTDAEWMATLLAKTKAEQKSAIEPALLAVKSSNTERFNAIDALAAAEKSALTAENTAIDQIIAAL